MHWFTHNKGNDCNHLAAAWTTWTQLANVVSSAGYGHLVRAYEPAQGANLDTVKDAIKTLRELYLMRVGDL